MVIGYFSAEHIQKVQVTNPHSLGEWFVFLLGGALGAGIILGLERVLDWRKDVAKRKHIAAAMDLEIDNNLQLCTKIMTNIHADDKMPYMYNRFSTVWMDKYSESCIDYGNEDSVRLEFFLYDAKALINLIHTTEDMLSMLHSTSKALIHFSNHIQSYNKSILANTVPLISVLDNIKRLRKGNKVYKKRCG